MTGLDEALAAGGGELVEAGPAVVFGNTPLRPDQPLGLEPVERGVERTLLDAEDIGGDLVDAVRDPETVSRLVLEGAEDEHVEGAVDEIGFFLGHEERGFHLDYLGQRQAMSAFLPRLSR